MLLSVCFFPLIVSACGQASTTSTSDETRPSVVSVSPTGDWSDLASGSTLSVRWNVSVSPGTNQGSCISLDLSPTPQAPAAPIVFPTYRGKPASCGFVPGPSSRIQAGVQLLQWSGERATPYIYLSGLGPTDSKNIAAATDSGTVSNVLGQQESRFLFIASSSTFESVSFDQHGVLTLCPIEWRADLPFVGQCSTHS
jgi:hypothetical protein